jgi:hypothetical protein
MWNNAGSPGRKLMKMEHKCLEEPEDVDVDEGALLIETSEKSYAVI